MLGGHGSEDSHSFFLPPNEDVRAGMLRRRFNRRHAGNALPSSWRGEPRRDVACRRPNVPLARLWTVLGQRLGVWGHEKPAQNASTFITSCAS
jgi:hypothetical protein